MFTKRTKAADTCTGLLTASVHNAATPSLRVFYDAAHQILTIDWQGDPDSEEIRNGYALIMEEVRAYKPKKLLFDLHNRGIISRADQRWVFSHVFPNVLRIIGDNVFVAVVLPVSLYSGLVVEMNGDELMHDNSFIIIHHSLYREEALRWLNNVNL